MLLARFWDHKRLGNTWTAALDDTGFYHWLIDTQKFAYAQRTHLGDVDFVPEALELARNMSSREYTRSILKRMPPHSMFSSYYENPNFLRNLTAHVCFFFL